MRKNLKTYLLKIYYQFLDLKEKFTIKYNQWVTSRLRSPFVYGTDETLDKLINENCSMSRYGDGEFALMYKKDLKFQPYSIELRDRLIDILRSNKSNHIVCVPNVFNSFDEYTQKAKDYWISYLNKNIHKIYRLLNKNNYYYNSLVTRLYIDVEDKDLVENRFNKIKKLWENRKVVVVEGEKSRLGIGNDLFSGAISIERIICPSIDAFSRYHEIFLEVQKESKDKLILVALGPTATVLAYDLYCLGYQALDIGHIDIEYEWFLSGVTEKLPVKNKYIGEINGGEDVSDITDLIYEQQIICHIK